MGEIKYCKNCLGVEPCWCEKHEYIATWLFIYNALMNTKGSK